MAPPPVLSLLRTILKLRRGGVEASYPTDPADYVRPLLDGGPGPAADGIPVAHTRTAHTPGNGDGYPAAVLSGCREPLPNGAPDLRGVWVVERGVMRGTVQRIEQAGDRVVITAGSLVHDMRADGTLENGVHDVGPTGRPVHVAAEFADGCLDLRPDGGRVMVSRRLDGDMMLWRYGPFGNRCRRLTGTPGA